MKIKERYYLLLLMIALPIRGIAQETLALSLNQAIHLAQKFSPEAIEELKVIVHAVSELFRMTLEVFTTDNTILAQEVEPLEQVIKKNIRKVKIN